MAKTTRVLSVTVPVPDQDRALEYYRDVLGCEVRYDGEPWSGRLHIPHPLLVDHTIILVGAPRGPQSAGRPSHRDQGRTSTFPVIGPAAASA
jgi:catechol 2,3-dioxygenase-like lactoylglutathione lyase family enzyme